MNAPKLTEDELRRLGQSWFAESRELSAQDDAEVAAWKKELRKWTTYSNEGFSASTTAATVVAATAVVVISRARAASS